MHKLTYYQPGRVPVNLMPLPVRGQQLSRKKHWQPHEREFWAADLYRGEKRLIKPTLAQVQFLTGAGSIAGVWWALQREKDRDEIMQGALPLVPPHSNSSKKEIDDATLFEIINKVGIEHLLTVAAAVDAQAHH